jgi:signal peptidase
LRVTLQYWAWRSGQAMRRLSVLAWLPAGFALTMLLAAAIPFAVGDRSYIVTSGSMSPAIETGDVVVASPISPSEARVGEILTFPDPEDNERLLVHRAVAIKPDGKRIAFVTQGDANTGRERWRVAADGQIGRVSHVVPKLGFVAAEIGTPAGRIGLVAIPALLLALMALRRIWFPSGGRLDERPA